MVMSRERAEKLRRRIRDLAEHEREVVKEAVGDLPLGAEELSDDQLLRFMELKLRDHPRTQVTLPPENEGEEGPTIFVSPYFVALEMVGEQDREAKALLDRYMRLVESDE